MRSANHSAPLQGLRLYKALLGLIQASGLAGGFDSSRSSRIRISEAAWQSVPNPSPEGRESQRYRGVSERRHGVQALRKLNKRTKGDGRPPSPFAMLFQEHISLGFVLYLSSGDVLAAAVFVRFCPAPRRLPFGKFPSPFLAFVVNIVIVNSFQVIGEPFVPDCQQPEECGLSCTLSATRQSITSNLQPGLNTLRIAPSMNRRRHS